MKIDTATRLYAVLGDPVTHSLGPVMHNRAFEEMGINGIYVALRVTDPKAVTDAVRTLGLAGCSVTIPHKEAVLEGLDEVTPFATKVGAVNTIINRNGHLVGDNTDGPAAMAALKAQIEVTGKKVALIGAGGAAKGIGHALCAADAVVTVLNRTLKNGKKLADELSVAFLPLPEIDKEAFDILINTTSVGMHPTVDNSPIGEYPLKENQVVMDIVYNPLETRLLAAARQKKCLMVDGVEMFVRQGAMQFELWTGVKAPYQKMDAVVRQELLS